MTFWKRLFGTKAEPLKPQTQARFGRYTDSYKEKMQYAAWETSLDLFDKEDYLGSYREFFKYLRDNREDNVRWIEANGGIEFEILQGSKRVAGFASAQSVNAVARIAHAENLNIAVMRRLVEANFILEYSRYGLDDDNNLVIKFDTAALDASPYKLYYGLKEVAVNADKQDDLLLDEFGEQLSPIDQGSKADLPTAERETRYAFIVEKIAATLAEIDNGKLDADKYPSGISYLLLDAAYRIDYLASPEGFTMETVERMNRLFFTKDERTTVQKNAALRKEFEKIVTRPKALIFNELYATTSSFGILQPKSHDTLAQLIGGELPNMAWYEESKHEAVALAVTGYVVGNALFTYALPKPDRELLELYYRIFEPRLMTALGLTPLQYFEEKTGVFDQKAIKIAVRDIIERGLEKHPRLAPNFNLLDFRTPTALARTYLNMVAALEFSPKE